MPLPKPREQKPHAGNWIASVITGIYLLANVLWIFSGPFSGLSLTGFYIFGGGLPIVLFILTVAATIKRLITGPVIWIAIGAIILCAAFAWWLLYLFAVGTAQV